MDKVLPSSQVDPVDTLGKIAKGAIGDKRNKASVSNCDIARCGQARGRQRTRQRAPSGSDCTTKKGEIT